MGQGFLMVNLFVGDYLLPVSNAKVLVKDKSGGILYELLSDENGATTKVSLDAPDVGSQPAFYDVEVPYFKNYMKVIRRYVEVFDKQTTILSIQMHYAVENYSDDFNTDIGIIDTERITGVCSRCGNIPSIGVLPESIAANEVIIPDYITVHLGSPDDNAAPNVTLPFRDYIANVASREIFPCWTEAAITANVMAQMSFALNRVYTLWYPSRGKNFDITNRTQWDQAFDPNKETFESIRHVVNNVFSRFIRRQGRREPFASSYCSGTTATCDGLKQCQSQDLGLQGFTAEQILKYFYPNDIQLVKSNVFGSAEGRYPGYPLREGSSGPDVLRMQVYLNRLSGNWYITPIPVGSVDGVFGSATKRAVEMFQRIPAFGLTPDGVIGSNTWYAIKRAYVAAKRLYDLTSEGERISIGAAPPAVTITTGADPAVYGQYIAELQFLLNFIAMFFENIPSVIQNSIFNDDTKRSVIYFQQMMGMSLDGIVGPATWKALYDVYKSLIGAEVPTERIIYALSVRTKYV